MPVRCTISAIGRISFSCVRAAQLALIFSLELTISLASRDALVDDGQFLVYQFTARVLPVLRATFPDVRRSRELRNLPPAQLFVCT